MAGGGWGAGGGASTMCFATLWNVCGIVLSTCVVRCRAGGNVGYPKVVWRAIVLWHGSGELSGCCTCSSLPFPRSPRHRGQEAERKRLADTAAAADADRQRVVEAAVQVCVRSCPQRVLDRQEWSCGAAYWLPRQLGRATGVLGCCVLLCVTFGGVCVCVWVGGGGRRSDNEQRRRLPKR